MTDKKATISQMIMDRIAWCHQSGIETTLFMYGEPGERPVKLHISEFTDIIDTEGDKDEKSGE